METKTSKVRILCEAGVLLAIAQILGYIVLYKFPNGGSIDLAMLPIIIFGARYGAAWGLGVGFVHGVLQYVLGEGIAIDWTTMVADYLVAYSLLGLGSGIAHYFPKNRMSWGILIGGILRFMAHFVVGALVWGKYMPETFFNMTMTSEWFYSFLYNGSYMFIDMLLVYIVIRIIRKPMSKYLGEKM